MSRRPLSIIGLVFWLLAGACGCSSSPYVGGYHYAPAPALVDVFRRGTDSKQQQQPALSVLVSVHGIRRADRNQRIPLSVEARMRFENNGPAGMTFDPRSLDLVTGTLEAFPPPDARPPGPIELAPGQTATNTAYFPLPPGRTLDNMSLDSLRLRWRVQLDNQTVPQTAYFERASPLYYAP